ncbi:MAG: hypothetical protein WKF30_19350 [Pyrinomonadaceae bacterium]
MRNLLIASGYSAAMLDATEAEHRAWCAPAQFSESDGALFSFTQ